MSASGSIQFHTLDVFTTERFGGNPLAVVPDATGLTDAQMQTIAREFNLSETVFVFPPRAGGTHHLRIFTPAAELPFAGHPTVGTALLLHDLSAGRTQTGQQFVFEEGIGPVAVDVRCDRGPSFAELQVTKPVEVRPSPLSVPELAALVSVAPNDIANTPAPCGASCGVPFLLIPLNDVGALGRARLDLARWSATLQDVWANNVYIYVLLDGSSGGNVQVRMFSPALGVPEDPATGGAAAAFAGFMGTLEPARPDQHWVITQGVEMKRPSTLHARVARSGGSTSIFVGGNAVRVSAGELWL